MEVTESVAIPPKRSMLKWTTGKANQTSTCVLCGAAIGKGRHCYRRDVRTNWFRGDDKVHLVHTECFSGLKRVVAIAEESA